MLCTRAAPGLDSVCRTCGCLVWGLHGASIDGLLRVLGSQRYWSNALMDLFLASCSTFCSDVSRGFFLLGCCAGGVIFGLALPVWLHCFWPRGLVFNDWGVDSLSASNAASPSSCIFFSSGKIASPGPCKDNGTRVLT